jgi:hypothetical protein
MEIGRWPGEEISTNRANVYHVQVTLKYATLSTYLWHRIRVAALGTEEQGTGLKYVLIIPVPERTAYSMVIVS